jgi:hypothetical protein
MIRNNDMARNNQNLVEIFMFNFMNLILLNERILY